MSQREQWIPLMDYAIKKGVSLSTLRRHIKAKKVPFRIENGKYFLLDTDGEDLPMAPPPTLSAAADSVRVAQLESDLQKAREEIAELKTLIAFYEENMSPHRLDN